MIQVINLKLTPDQALSKDDEILCLRNKMSERLRVVAEDISDVVIRRKAIDARHKHDIHFVYSVTCSVKDQIELLEKRIAGVSFASQDPEIDYPGIGNEKLAQRPLIIGAGPSGLFAALILARHNYRPLIIDRGETISGRLESYHRFLKTRVFEERASLVYGEGGAGTYSDGKLTTLINDPRCFQVLRTLIEHGADPEIAYLAKPHLGTDKLSKIISSITREIINLGGEIRFNTKAEHFIVEGGRFHGVVLEGGETLAADLCLLGIGHSAFDTVQALASQGLKIAQKPFSIGFRIEHPQQLINQAQYGKFATHPALGAADYKLVYHGPDSRSAYTFCMCPGGHVVCSTSESGGLVTNGMSFSQRNFENANAALLVGVGPGDYGSSDPLAGFMFRRTLETEAFRIGGGNYNAPIQLLQDFLLGKDSTSLGTVKPSYLPGTTFARLDELIPGYASTTIKKAIADFDRRLKGFAINDAVLTAIESRSSSPVRLERGPDHQANISGIYPMGEGSGYAGGIMSSAVDGIKTALRVMSRFTNS